MINSFFIVLPLGTVMAVGWFLRRKNLVTEVGLEDMNRLLYWVAMPAILFRSTIKVDPELFSNVPFMCAVYSVFAILPFISWWLAKMRGLPVKKLAVSVLTSVRGNNVFMGLPAVTIALGEAGLESYGIYLALSLVVYQIISISMGQFALSGELSISSFKQVFGRLIRNPMLLSCLLGVAGAFGGFGAIPHWIDQTLVILGNVGSGVALMALGASLVLNDLVSSIRQVWSDLIVRLILSPLLTLLAFQLFPVDPMLVKTSVLVAAMPAAVNNFVLAKGMGMDGDYAGKVVVTSTVCSVLTITLWLSVMGA
ncbi:MAG: AEC family transporter [Synergistales bacterium]|nr:AEC family transporter [Dethiosulfovibrio sp.]NCC95948.1 AEC family transporter [Synergistales bacterium]